MLCGELARCTRQLSYGERRGLYVWRESWSYVLLARYTVLMARVVVLWRESWSVPSLTVILAIDRSFLQPETSVEIREIRVLPAGCSTHQLQAVVFHRGSSVINPIEIREVLSWVLPGFKKHANSWLTHQRRRYQSSMARAFLSQSFAGSPPATAYSVYYNYSLLEQHGIHPLIPVHSQGAPQLLRQLARLHL